MHEAAGLWTGRLSLVNQHANYTDIHIYVYSLPFLLLVGSIIYSFLYPKLINQASIVLSVLEQQKLYVSHKFLSFMVCSGALIKVFSHLILISRV